MRSRRLTLAICCIVPSGSAAASHVTASTTTNQDGTKTTTITVTPEAGESIRDLHVRPTGTGTKVPRGSGTTFGGPSGWSDSDNKAWRSWGSGSAASAAIGSGGETFTITVPADHDAYSTFKWKTTNNGSNGSPPPDNSSYVEDHGTSDPNQTIPYVSVGIFGPGTARLGQTVTLLASNPIPESETLTYTVRFSRSLDPQDPSRIDDEDMVPDSMHFGLSTNSRTGTSTPSEGVRSATFFGDMRNHVVLDVPDDIGLLGQTFYLQVDWSDGLTSAPEPITFVSQ